MQKTHTFFLFTGEQCGKALEAARLYTSLFKNSEIKDIKYMTPEQTGYKEGMITHALFTIDGQEYLISDGPGDHKFPFNPSISIAVNCETEEEIDSLFRKMTEGGSVMMPLGEYGFSKKFAWIADQYGVSWQLILF
ncbi:MAG TPA: VOC family protein [Chitinophagaceae bacterium]|nr:VOC family protein [Chitinophagaceae bacterium]